MSEQILPGVRLTVDVPTNNATLQIGNASIEFEWNADAQSIFTDLENACPIELLSVIGEVEKHVAGAAVTAADKERSTFWRNLEQAAANLSDEEAAFIAGETKELRSVKPVSPIGEGNTPLHVLIKILDGNI